MKQNQLDDRMLCVVPLPEQSSMSLHNAGQRREQDEVSGVLKLSGKRSTTLALEVWAQMTEADAVELNIEVRHGLDPDAIKPKQNRIEIDTPPGVNFCVGDRGVSYEYLTQFEGRMVLTKTLSGPSLAAARAGGLMVWLQSALCFGAAQVNWKLRRVARADIELRLDQDHAPNRLLLPHGGYTISWPADSLRSSEVIVRMLNPHNTAGRLIVRSLIEGDEAACETALNLPRNSAALVSLCGRDPGRAGTVHIMPSTPDDLYLSFGPSLDLVATPASLDLALDYSLPRQKRVWRTAFHALPSDTMLFQIVSGGTLDAPDEIVLDLYQIDTEVPDWNIAKRHRLILHPGLNAFPINLNALRNRKAGRLETVFQFTFRPAIGTTPILRDPRLTPIADDQCDEIMWSHVLHSAVHGQVL